MVGPFESLKGYERGWLSKDALAGLTVWAVLIPEALAYASIAGVSPVVGLYAVPAALVFYAALGSSRHLVVGPSAATAALSAATVGDLVAGDSGAFAAMTAALAITVGLIALISGLLRIGFLANFVSAPVLKGFIVGLTLVILIGQAPKLFGVEGGDGDFFEQAWALLKDLGEADGLTMLIGFGSLGLIIGMKRVDPRLPAYLVVVFLGIAIIEAFGLGDDTAIVGPVESGLPSVGLPDVGITDLAGLIAGAAGLMFVGFAEGLGAAKTYASKDHYEIDPDRELIGIGVANIGAGFSSGMAVNGSLSKTAVSVTGGARTQLSGLIVAVMAVVTILLLTGLFESLPEATLAAVVVAALVDLVDIPGLRRLYGAYTARLGRVYGLATRADFIAAVAAMLGVMIFDTLPGLVIGITLSLLLLIYRSSRPNVARLGRLPGERGRWEDVDRHDDAVEDPRIVVLRPEGGLFFANSDQVRKVVLDAVGPGVEAVVLDVEAVAFLDVTGARMLEDLSDQLDARGVGLFMAKDIGQVRDVIGVSTTRDRLLSRTFATIPEAIRAATDSIDAGLPRG